MKKRERRSFVSLFSQNAYIQLLIALVHLLSGFVVSFVLNKDQGDVKRKGVFNITIQTEPEPIGTINLFYAIASFLYMTCFAHILYAWFLIKRGNYELVSNRKTFEGSQVYRWIEYSITASIMFVIISVLSRITDLYLLITLATLIHVTMYFGYIFDVTEKRFYFWLGCIPYTIAWGIEFTQFYSVLHHSQQQVPDFVYGVIWVTFLFFSSFAVVHYVCGPQSMVTDAWMHFLSFTSKSILAYWVAGGTMGQ